MIYDKYKRTGTFYRSVMTNPETIETNNIDRIPVPFNSIVFIKNKKKVKNTVIFVSDLVVLDNLRNKLFQLTTLLHKQTPFC